MLRKIESGALKEISADTRDLIVFPGMKALSMAVLQKFVRTRMLVLT